MLRAKAQMEEIRLYEPLRTSELVAVHLTRYQFKRDEQGRLTMVSTFDATDWKAPRNTVHFALNHPVAAHMYDSWENAGYAVIAPMNSMTEQNGNPTVLNTVDTFWEVNPGEKFVLPADTWLVKPGDLEKGKLYEQREGNELVYKDKFEPYDIKILTGSLSQHERYYLNQSIWHILGDSTYYGIFWGNDRDGIIKNEDFEKIQERLGGYGGYNELDLLAVLEQQPPKDLVMNILRDAGLDDRVADDVTAKIQRDIKGRLIDKVKQLAINSQIKALGYETHSGGMWAWGDSWEVTRRTMMLGAEIGVPVLAHTDHITHAVEDQFISGGGYLARLQAGEITYKEYRENAFKFLAEKFPKMSAKSRRMMYLIGAL